MDPESPDHRRDDDLDKPEVPDPTFPVRSFMMSPSQLILQERQRGSCGANRYF